MKMITYFCLLLSLNFAFASVPERDLELTACSNRYITTDGELLNILMSTQQTLNTLTELKVDAISSHQVQLAESLNLRIKNLTFYMDDTVIEFKRSIGHLSTREISKFHLLCDYLNI